MCGVDTEVQILSLNMCLDMCEYLYVLRPRVHDGKPAEVVCGYFGDWFYRVGKSV